MKSEKTIYTYTRTHILICPCILIYTILLLMSINQLIVGKSASSELMYVLESSNTLHMYNKKIFKVSVHFPLPHRKK